MIRSCHRCFSAGLVFALMCACTALAQTRPGAAPPPDDEIASRIRGNGKGKGIQSVDMTQGKQGELTFKASEQTWYFQRGYLVRRDASLPDFPRAVLVVGGLAVYRHSAGRWVHVRDLVTFNRYEGLPQPDNDQLLVIARQTPERAFAGDWHLVVGGLVELRIPETPAFKWHNAQSLSFPVVARYTFRWDAVHPVDCTREWQIRVYRQPNGEWGNPSGTRVRDLSPCRT